MFDFQTLKVIWWLLLGVLLIGFAVMDGFDLGAGMLLPFIGKSDTERRVVINTIGPVCALITVAAATPSRLSSMASPDAIR